MIDRHNKSDPLLNFFEIRPTVLIWAFIYLSSVRSIGPTHTILSQAPCIRTMDLVVGLCVFVPKLSYK